MKDVRQSTDPRKVAPENGHRGFRDGSNREWRMVRLQRLLGKLRAVHGTLADNHLSAREGHLSRQVSQGKYVHIDELDSLWRDIRTQFERAVLNSDAEWFGGHAKTLDATPRGHARAVTRPADTRANRRAVNVSASQMLGGSNQKIVAFMQERRLRC
jgi:hypothetical protein